MILIESLRTFFLDYLPQTWQWITSLLIVTGVALLFAAFLSPLEALGWWAGWYGDSVDTNVDPGTLVKPTPQQTPSRRYVIYLDGIGQAEADYFPNIKAFLSQLSQTLPDEIVIIQGIMTYSPMNRPLTKGRVLSFFWRLADNLQSSKSKGIFGVLIALTINIRNILIVTVSADQRYGAIYNQGTAQVMYNSLLAHGYVPENGTPITLIGYSGGAQIALGAAPYLRQALAAPIEVISVSGVLSGNLNVLQLERLYHLVGDKDWVEKEGAILFPRRWRIFFFSYWNRAKRRGKINMVSLGSVTHKGTGGPFDPDSLLADGRTHLQQTVDLIAGLIQGHFPLTQIPKRSKPSNYDRYLEGVFNHPSYYPLDQTVDLSLYRPISDWMGRLILPTPAQRPQVQGVLLEVHHAPQAYQELIGQIVYLRWRDLPRVQKYRRQVTQNVHFSPDAEYSQRQGRVHPVRLNHWQLVDPLESLAGSRYHDDVIVKLLEVEVENHDVPVLTITTEPVQITGRYYSLVKILRQVKTTGDLDYFQVVHFNRDSRQFDGREETVVFPQVIANKNGVLPSQNKGLTTSNLNQTGWYLYGAPNATGQFVVQALAPRRLLQLQPDRVISGRKPIKNYLTQATWKVEGKKGTVSSVLLNPNSDQQKRITPLKEGDCALLIHLYGGIGGKKAEPAAQFPVYFGHFAYGVAEVVHDPLADELRFETEYHQIYTHNPDGIIAGTLAQNRYLGDRQFGWLGTRPTWDLLIHFDPITRNYHLQDLTLSPLQLFFHYLNGMKARYRIGDGTGGTFVDPAHNCVQDSNQALYAVIKHIETTLRNHPDYAQWLESDPQQAQAFNQLVHLGQALRRKLLPLGTARADWHSQQQDNLGLNFEDYPLKAIWRSLVSWRTLFPRSAAETLVQQFLKQGASVWILRTNQVGGVDPDIEPVAPTRIL